MSGPKKGAVALIAGMLGVPVWGAIPPVQAPLLEIVRPNEEESIRIRVAEMNLGEISQVRGLDLQVGRLKVSRTRIRCESKGIRIGNTIPTARVEVSSPAGFIYWNGSPVRGRLSWVRTARGCDVVNELGIEKYLDGLVNSEFSSKWHPEAVAAQVIAARSYALAQRKRARSQKRHYDLESTVSDQVYQGVKSEDYLAARLVQRTRGWVLTLPDRSPAAHSQSQVLKAYYHSRCGGETELPRRVWGASDKGFKQVSCPYCRHSPGFDWETRLTALDVQNALTRGIASDGTSAQKKSWRNIGTKDIGKAKLHTDTGGRVIELQIKNTKISGNEFRKWVGYSTIKSTLFSIHSMGTGIIFKGKGNGHGVGMCQWGAKIMAEKGAKTADILKLYYPGALLRKLW